MRDYKELIEALRSFADSYVQMFGEGESSKLMNDASDAIEDLIAALTASNEVIAKSGNGWISVEERLPDVNERVVACVSIHGEPSVWDAVRWNGKEWEAEEEVVYEYWTSIDFPVTHWMPLPEPPKEDNDA